MRLVCVLAREGGFGVDIRGVFIGLTYSTRGALALMFGFTKARI